GDPTQEPTGLDLDFGVGVEGLSKTGFGVLGWSRFECGVQGVSGNAAKPIPAFLLRAGVFGIASEAPTDIDLKVTPVGVLGSSSTNDNNSSAIGVVGVAGNSKEGNKQSVGVFGQFAGAGKGIGVYAEARQNPLADIFQNFALVADGQGGPAAHFLGS